jgi:hypothetical protein
MVTVNGPFCGLHLARVKRMISWWHLQLVGIVRPIWQMNKYNRSKVVEAWYGFPY